MFEKVEFGITRLREQNTTGCTLSTIDWYNNPNRQHMVSVETTPSVKKKKPLPVEPWRSKRKGGKGIR